MVVLKIGVHGRRNDPIRLQRSCSVWHRSSEIRSWSWFSLPVRHQGTGSLRSGTAASRAAPSLYCNVFISECALRFCLGFLFPVSSLFFLLPVLSYPAFPSSSTPSVCMFFSPISVQAHSHVAWFHMHFRIPPALRQHVLPPSLAQHCKDIDYIFTVNCHAYYLVQSPHVGRTLFACAS